MPLLDDLGLTPRVTPERQIQQDQRAALKALLDPLTQRAGEQGQTGSLGLGVPTATGQNVRQDAITSQMLDTIQQIQGFSRQQTIESARKQAYNLITTTLFQQPQSSAPATPGAVPASLAGIIGKRNYQVGRGDPAIRSLAQNVANFMGWGSDQFSAWDALINAESGWRPTAQNPTSTAYGLGQFLNSTWGPYGPKTSDPNLQLQYMARYIKGRYGDPIHALIEHNRKHWY